MKRERSGNAGKPAELVAARIHFNTVDILPLELEDDM